VVGEIVLAVADQDHHAADDVRLVAGRTRRVAEFLHASLINGVVDGRAAAGARAVDFVAQEAGVAGERLDDLRLVVEGHDEGFVFAVAEDAEEEVVGGVLLELDAVADAVGSVHEHANTQRQIGLFAEIADVLGNVVVEDFEVLLVERGDQLVAAVEDSEEDVHKIDLDGDDRLAFGDGLLRVLLLGILLLRILRRRRGRSLLLGEKENATQQNDRGESTQETEAHVH